jgi:pimeloyl-ACP methyl ester carboxylesterase
MIHSRRENKKMLDEQKLLESLQGVSDTEYKRFEAFLTSHTMKYVQSGNVTIPYYHCGEGPRTILIFAGGWGGPQLVFETILGFEEKNRIVVIDVSDFDNPEDFSLAANLVLEEEQVPRVILMGQSASGITAQVYFKRNYDRVDAMVLTNTLAPRPERSKKWALWLLQVFPFSLLKALAKKKLTKLRDVVEEIPADVKERRRFAGALMAGMMDHYITRHKTINMLKLAFAFNEQDKYLPGDLAGWRGKALLVTSEDDPYYKDVALLEEGLPNSEVFKLPQGFKHLAPQILRDEFHARIQKFIDGLDLSSGENPG